MTVAELIKELQKLPPQHRVMYMGQPQPFIEVRSANVARVIEPKTEFGQGIPVRDPLPLPKEIDVVILK